MTRGQNARQLPAIVVSLLLMALVLPVWAQQLKVTVVPDRAGDGTLTGNYVASFAVEGAPTAREAVFGFSFPKAAAPPVGYELELAPEDIWILAVVPGADVVSIDANDPPTPADPSDDTPVVFAESATAADLNTVWIVALLTEVEKSPKKICDIVFTSRGKSTVSLVNFEAGVSVKDGALAELIADGTYGSAQVPVFADLDWTGVVGFDDFFLFLEAWEKHLTAVDIALADLNPRVDPGEIDPTLMLTLGDNDVDFDDFFDFLLGWEEDLKAHGTSVSAAMKEGAR